MPLEFSRRVIGTFRSSKLANAEISKTVGDVTIVTSTTRNSSNANVEISKTTGVVKIVIEMLPSSKVVNAEILRTIGTATTVIWTLRSSRPASAATKSDLFGFIYFRVKGGSSTDISLFALLNIIVSD